ncbi:tyrosine--tRNA ligase [Marinivivus vitaminiproducens]|uniref:tyrosine--tRNA ligase n=1 Tax=Marinivivus vitaminiproducens TaxID=3035935 RepID=UPI0027A42074|nr:tyrosine--tRNA ligase [Geminicoccaceae bacterium SCSIO 64248]
MSPSPRSPFLRHLFERGYVHQTTDLDGLDTLFERGPVTAYIGFDATADSLHVGHLVQTMILRSLAAFGHRPIALMGGGTTKVGDPSFRDDARPLLDDAAIEANKQGIQAIMERFLPFGDGPGSAVMLDNDAWLSELRYVPFLRDFGRHFTVNRMLTFDSVRLRLEREQPLTLLEFNYMVMQAYDFLELARRQGCRVQFGGSDQWGNIVNGIELGRRVEGLELFGLTTPLLTTASGAKMGKTAQGAVWLAPHRLPVFDYYQFWRNTEDADVGRFLKLFTELPIDECERLGALQEAEINEAKTVLAFEATKLCHGEDAAHSALASAQAMYARTGDDLSGLPVAEVASDILQRGVAAAELLQLAGLVESKGEARRLIRGGGARLNDSALDDETRLVGAGDLTDGVLKLSLGRKRHILVRPV